MRRVVLLFGSLATVSLSAQTQARQPIAPPVLGDDAPKVSIWIDGPRAFEFGSGVRVHLQVSDNAYVIAGRVASDGRLTIIYPSSPTGRTFVPGNTDIQVRGLHTPLNTSFYADEPQGQGYVFAIASYSPLDVTQFKFADFERYGLSYDASSFPGPFQLAVGGRVWSPESMVERLASWTLFDDRTPFDYDYDFYSVSVPVYAAYADSPLESCFVSVLPFLGLCQNYYNSFLSCLTYSIDSYGGCTSSYQPLIIRTLGPGSGGVGGGHTGNSKGPINTKVLLGGFAHPDTVSQVSVHDPRTGAERPGRTPGAGDPPRSQVDGTTGHFYSVPGHTLGAMHQAQIDVLRKKDGTQRQGARAWTTSDGPNDPSRTADVPAQRGFESQPATPRTSGQYRTSTDTRRDVSGSPPPREQPRSAEPRGSAPTNDPAPRAMPAQHEAPRSAPVLREAPRASPPPRQSSPPPARSSPPPEHHDPPPSSSSSGNPKKP